MKKSILLGMLGVQTDRRSPENRWRPSLSIFQQQHVAFDRFELIHQKQFQETAEELREDVREVSPTTDVTLREVDFEGDPWNFETVFAGLFDLVHNYPWDPDEEEYYLHISTGTHTCQICFYLLAESRHIPARLMQSHPMPKPDEAGRELPFSVIDLRLDRYSLLAERFSRRKRSSQEFLKEGIATRNAVFNRLIEEIERVSESSTGPILLMGPTGAGKSRLARRVYELRKARGRIAGDFVEINCGTLRGEAAMSALFGHLRGSFTGAMKDRPGLLKAADGGLLFLDEIGELGLDEQVMLLRALEEKRFLPLGADQEESSDFQLICGTNKDLGVEVAARRFRGDLLARINLWSFHLPGLKERFEDFEPNLDYELEQFRRRNRTRVRFQKEARQRYLEFAAREDSLWSGNFRDLNASVTRMATMAGDGLITEPIVAREEERLNRLWQQIGGRGSNAGNDGSGGRENECERLLRLLLGEDGVENLDVFDRVQLAEVVRVCRSSPSLSAAGRKLFQVSLKQRKGSNDADRLRKYLARYNLDFRGIQEVAA